jgi:hypothetical protein
MSSYIDTSELIGKPVRDEFDRETGRIVSFLIDASGQAQEVLVENNYGKLVKCSIDMLKTEKDKVLLLSYVDKKVTELAEQLPITMKKRKILDKLSQDRVLPAGIYESLCKEFDKNLKAMKNEAQALLEDIDVEIKEQEDQVKTLQLGRAFIEIEHGIGTVQDEVYQQSIISILKEVKSAQQKKLRLLRTKDKIIDILQEEEEEPVKEVKAEPAEEAEKEETIPTAEAEAEPEPTQGEDKQVIPVRVTE